MFISAVCPQRTPCFFQEGDQLVLGEQTDMAGDLLPVLIDENLGRNELNAVFSAGFGVFPDVVEDDLDLAFVLGGDLLHDRLHRPCRGCICPRRAR
ncbi:MAG: hypothetical protein MZV63_26060 [Marinilabiliales bacterium]|nr:hypothetical protein [Marinilabiliales bacterium]